MWPDLNAVAESWKFLLTKSIFLFLVVALMMVITICIIISTAVSFLRHWVRTISMGRLQRRIVQLQEEMHKLEVGPTTDSERNEVFRMRAELEHSQSLLDEACED